MHTENQLPRLPGSAYEVELEGGSGGWGSGDPNFFLHISFSWVKIKLHTEIQLLRLPGSALKVLLGWWVVVQLITLSTPTRVEVELG